MPRAFKSRDIKLLQPWWIKRIWCDKFRDIALRQPPLIEIGLIFPNIISKSKAERTSCHSLSKPKRMEFMVPKVWKDLVPWPFRLEGYRILATPADGNRFDISGDEFKEQSWKNLVSSYPLQTQRYEVSGRTKGLWCHDPLKSRDITL